MKQSTPALGKGPSILPGAMGDSHPIATEVTANANTAPGLSIAGVQLVFWESAQRGV